MPFFTLVILQKSGTSFLKMTEKLVHAFVTSRLDYCISLLSACPNKTLNSFLLIQNAATRVLSGTRERDHISCVLASLHWLPVKSRIQFKILLTYKPPTPTLNDQAPSNLKKLIVPYYPSRTPAPRTQAYLWFLESLLAEWEAEPSVISLLCWPRLLGDFP